MNRISILNLATVTATALLLVSCYSASLTSSFTVSSDPNESSPTAVRISSITIDGAELGEVNNYNSLYSYVRMQSTGVSMYPELFSMNNRAIPLHIAISTDSESNINDLRNALFYGFTFGFSPLIKDSTTLVSVRVGIGGDSYELSNKLGERIYQVRQRSALSVSSPIGLRAGVIDPPATRMLEYHPNREATQARNFVTEQIIDAIADIVLHAAPTP